MNIKEIQAKRELRDQFRNTMIRSAEDFKRWCSSPGQVIDFTDALSKEYLFQEAKELGNKVLTLRPKSYLSWLILGKTYTREGLFKESRYITDEEGSFSKAKIALSRTKEMKCPQRVLYPEIVIMSLRMGEWASARKALTNIQNKSNNIDIYKESKKWVMSYVYCKLASRADERNDRDKAQYFINKALKINPHDCYLYYYCHILSLIRCVLYPNVTQLYTRWIKYEPTNGLPYLYLGITYYNMGRYIAAGKIFNKAAKVLDNLPENRNEYMSAMSYQYQNRAMVYWSQGILEKAKYYFTESSKYQRLICPDINMMDNYIGTICLDENIRDISRLNTLNGLRGYIYEHCIKAIEVLLQSSSSMIYLPYMITNDIAWAKILYIIALYTSIICKIDLKARNKIDLLINKYKYENSRYVLRQKKKEATDILLIKEIDRDMFIDTILEILIIDSKIDGYTIRNETKGLVIYICENAIKTLQKYHLNESVLAVEALIDFVDNLSNMIINKTSSEKEKELILKLDPYIRKMGYDLSLKTLKTGEIITKIKEVIHNENEDQTNILLNNINKKVKDRYFKQINKNKTHISTHKGSIKNSEYKLVFKNVYGKHLIQINDDILPLIQELPFVQLLYLAAVRKTEQDKTPEEYRWIDKNKELYMPSPSTDKARMSNTLGKYNIILERNKSKGIRFISDIKPGQIIINESIISFTTEHWIFAENQIENCYKWINDSRRIEVKDKDVISKIHEFKIMQYTKDISISKLHSKIIAAIKNKIIFHHALIQLGWSDKCSDKMNRLINLKKKTADILGYMDKDSLDKWLRGEYHETVKSSSIDV